MILEKMKTSLTLPADQPTHRLSVKMEDGTRKYIYLTAKEARLVRESINGPKQFITLKDTDEAFPKYDANLHKLTKSELSERRRRYLYQGKDIAEEEKDEVLRKKREKVEDWILKHPKEWRESIKEAREILTKEGNFNRVGLSTHAAEALIKSKARLLISNQLQKNEQERGQQTEIV